MLSTEFKIYRMLHRRMWRWLAKNPGKEKEDWPGWRRRYKDSVVQACVEAGWSHRWCFACAYTDMVCAVCPIFHNKPRPVGSRPCTSYGALFKSWVDAMHVFDYAGQTEYAAKIAEMPWTPTMEET